MFVTYIFNNEKKNVKRAMIYLYSKNQVFIILLHIIFLFIKQSQK